MTCEVYWREGRGNETAQFYTGEGWVKTSLKVGEHLRLATDTKHASFMVYVEHGIVHVTVQPKYQPTRVVIADKNVKIEVS